MHDLIIVGGGSAGLSAALTLGRMRRRIVVLDAGQPRNRVAEHMHGVLGRDGTSPLELLAAGRRELERYGVELAPEQAVTAWRDDDHVVVQTAGGAEVAARQLLVATGLQDELPAIAGLADLWGNGVAVCPYCDGWEARDGAIAVLHGPRAPHLAQLLRGLSERIVYLTDGAPRPEGEALLELTARGIAIEERAVQRLVARDGRLQACELADGAVLQLDALFLGPHLRPNDALLRALGVATVERFGERWPLADAAGRTSLPNVWAAGNVVDPVANVPQAIAAGVTAAIAINGALVDADVGQALTAMRSAA